MSIISIAITDSAPAPVLGADYGAPKTIMPLDSGTVWAVAGDGMLLAIWYLEADALLSVIADGTLSARAFALHGVSNWAYLVVAGSLNYQRWPWASIQGALLSVQELGVAILRVKTADDVPDLILQLAKRDRAPKRIRPPRTALFFTPGEDMLLALPGIGGDRLDKLMAFAGDPANALLALTDTSVNIPHIPKSVQEAARQAIGLVSDVRLGLDVIDPPINTATEETQHGEPTQNARADRARRTTDNTASTAARPVEAHA